MRVPAGKTSVSHVTMQVAIKYDLNGERVLHNYSTTRLSAVPKALPASLVTAAAPSGGNDNDNIFISVHLSQGMRINYVHVHYANFALIIVMNLTNFNNILTSRLLNSLCISKIPTRHISQTFWYI